MKKLLGGLALIGMGFMGGMYVGEQHTPLKQHRMEKYQHMSAEDGFPTNFLSYRDSLRINENNRVELYFGSDSTDVWRKVHSDGTVGSFSEKVDEWWNDQKQSIKNYFK